MPWDGSESTNTKSTPINCVALCRANKFKEKGKREKEIVK